MKKILLGATCLSSALFLTSCGDDKLDNNNYDELQSILSSSFDEFHATITISYTREDLVEADKEAVVDFYRRDSLNYMYYTSYVNKSRFWELSDGSRVEYSSDESYFNGENSNNTFNADVSLDTALNETPPPFADQYLIYMLFPHTYDFYDLDLTTKDGNNYIFNDDYYWISDFVIETDGNKVTRISGTNTETVYTYFVGKNTPFTFEVTFDSYSNILFPYEQ